MPVARGGRIVLKDEPLDALRQREQQRTEQRAAEQHEEQRRGRASAPAAAATATATTPAEHTYDYPKSLIPTGIDTENIQKFINASGVIAAFFVY